MCLISAQLLRAIFRFFNPPLFANLFGFFFFGVISKPEYEHKMGLKDFKKKFKNVFK